MMQRQNAGPGAVIVGGAQGSLAVARSLGRRGIPSFFVTHDNQLTRFSRYVHGAAGWIGPEHPDAADALLAIGRRHGLDGCLLIPGGDSEVRFVAEQRAKLAQLYKITTPDWDTARWALDKRRTYERAASLGIDHPWSLYPRSIADIAADELRFPMILKPAVRWSSNAFTLAKAWRVDDCDTLLARCHQAFSLAGDDGVVLQEKIPGDGSAQFSYAALWDRGQPVAELVARRARQYPLEFGYSSTLVETVECAEVEQAAVRFLTSLDYTGLVEVEFKYDSRDRRYKLLDVNVRNWTWISLGTAVGVDFPHLLWRLANGETVPRARGREGASWVYASRDAIAACQLIAARKLSVTGFMKSLRTPLTFAVFAKDDMMPFIVELPLVGWRLLTRRLPLLAGEFRASLTRWLNVARARLPLRANPGR